MRHTAGSHRAFLANPSKIAAGSSGTLFALEKASGNLWAKFFRGEIEVVIKHHHKTAPAAEQPSPAGLATYGLPVCLRLPWARRRHPHPAYLSLVYAAGDSCRAVGRR